MSADINGQHFDRPSRCINNAGMWGEFDEVKDKSCGPYWGPFTPGICSSGNRIYSARLWNITGDWLAACEATPAVVAGDTFSPPSLRCMDRRAAGMWGEVSIPDGACADLVFRGTVTYNDGSPAPGRLPSERSKFGHAERGWDPHVRGAKLPPRAPIMLENIQ